VHETRIPLLLNALESRFHQVKRGLGAVTGSARVSRVTQVSTATATAIRGKAKDSRCENASDSRRLAIEATIWLRPLNPSSPALRAVLHDPEDFYIKKRSKPFAITGNLAATPMTAAPVIVDGNPRERNGSRMGNTCA
jgi:hypothetical protein